MEGGRPEFWKCDETDSFAKLTYDVRIPRIVRGIVSSHKEALTKLPVSISPCASPFSLSCLVRTILPPKNPQEVNLALETVLENLKKDVAPSPLSTIDVPPSDRARWNKVSSSSFLVFLISVFLFSSSCLRC